MANGRKSRVAGFFGVWFSDPCVHENIFPRPNAKRKSNQSPAFPFGLRFEIKNNISALNNISMATKKKKTYLLGGIARSDSWTHNRTNRADNQSNRVTLPSVPLKLVRADSGRQKMHFKLHSRTNFVSLPVDHVPYVIGNTLVSPVGSVSSFTYRLRLRLYRLVFEKEIFSA